MKNRFSVFDGEIYDSTAGLIFADGESVYRATPVKDDDLTLLKEIIRRANAFEPGGEVERLRAAVDGVDFDDVISSIQCHGNDRCTSEKDWGEVDGMIRSLRVLIEVRAALAQEPAHAKA